MTTKEKQGFGLYFLLAFGLAWLCQVGGCMALLQKQNAVLYQLALVATMLCPLLAVLLVQKVFLRQPTGIVWKVQAPLLAGGVVRPDGIHGAGRSALFCGVPASTGPLRQLAGSGLRRRDGRSDPAQGAGRIQP